MTDADHTCLFPGPLFDPYQWPVYSSGNSWNSVAHMLYGACIYEAVISLNLYFSICTKDKLKTPIFRLMTVSVFSTIGSLLLSMVDASSLGSEDLIMGKAEIGQKFVNIILIVTTKIVYDIAATMRTRSLLSKYPKILMIFYIMLVICIINNLMVIVGLGNFWIRLHMTQPDMFLENLPDILEALHIAIIQSSVCVMFDMTFSSILMVAFLYPIFQNLEMDASTSIRVMLKLGDVQKALLALGASILYAAFVLSLPSVQPAIAATNLWANAQNSLFLGVSYKSTGELLNKSSCLSLLKGNASASGKLHVSNNVSINAGQTADKSQDKSRAISKSNLTTPVVSDAKKGDAMV